MKISDKDTDQVLVTLQNNLQGLSISELSRKCGINRNKVSAISEILARKGVLCCSCRYKSKVYSIKYQSPIHAVLEHIPEPALIVDENLNILRINPAYAAEYAAGEPEILSQPVQFIPDIPFAPVAVRLDCHLKEGREGEKREHQDETGTGFLTSIRILLPNHRPGLLLILHQARTVQEEQKGKDRLLETLILLAREMPGIISDTTLQEAFFALSNLIGKSYPECLILSLIVDESARRGRFTAIEAETAQKRARESMEILLRENLTIPVPEAIISEYKTGRILTVEESANLFGSETMQGELKKAGTALSGYGIATIGITWNRILVGIVGMGSPRDTGTAGEFLPVLSSIPGFFAIAGMSADRRWEARRLTEEFQARYRDIYTILAKKAEEENLLAARAKHFRNLAGAFADHLNLPLLATNAGGFVQYANQAAMQTFRIREQNPAEPVRLQAILPEELINLLAERADRKKSRYLKGEPLGVTREIHGSEMSWYLAGNPEDPESGVLIYIGEKTPVTHIRNILSLLQDWF